MKKLIENNKDEFLIQTGKTAKVKSVYAIVLYDPNDGAIRHMHHVISMEGSLPNKAETIEKAAISNAKRVGHNVEVLKILHVENLEDPSSQYRVDIKTQNLVKLSRVDILNKKLSEAD